MSDIGAVVLYKLLDEKSLEAWSRIKLAFLDPAYSSIYTAINKHYTKYNTIPGFDDLEVTSRDTPLSRSVAALKELEVPDVDLDVAIDALIDSYSQAEALNLIDKFLDKATIMDTEEIKESLSEIVLKLDEKTHTSETVMDMGNLILFEEAENLGDISTPLGLNNTLDSITGGAFKEELILLGGSRGSGKSITCSNIAVNQYEIGNSAVYFTIEMKAYEILHRNMAILANVDHGNIRKRTLTDEEIMRLAKAKAGMFENGDECYLQYLNHKNRFKFEKDLQTNYRLKEDNQIIIVDDRELTITSIDLHLQKLKAKFKDKFRLAVIDYVNQIVVPGHERGMYDWTTQIFISKKLKEYARKYGITIVSPYQIDNSGETRFAKGILDAADIAALLNAHTKEDNCITFETTKIRSSGGGSFTSGINWSTLRIDPRDVPKPESKKTKKGERTGGIGKPLPTDSKDEGGDIW